MKTVIGVFLTFALAFTANCQYIIDTDVPTNTVRDAFNVYNEGPSVNDDSLSCAQEFSLNHLASISRIEVYMAGYASVQLMTQIGTNTTVTNMVTNFTLTSPTNFNGSNGTNFAWVGTNLNLNLTAGNYFLVFNGDSVSSLSSKIPALDGDSTGPSFIAYPYPLHPEYFNYPFPPASRFTNSAFAFGSTSNSYIIALRITGSNTPLASAGLSLASYAGITVTGTVGGNYRVDYATSLAPTNWITLTNFILMASPALIFDSTAPIQNNRFYRAVPQ